MSDKDIVLTNYPDAKLRIYGGTYHAIENGDVILGAGRSYSAAWKDAREFVELQNTACQTG